MVDPSKKSGETKFHDPKPQTVEHFDSSLGASTSSDELLKVLTDCREFAEMPVRHNEDLLNTELAKQCPVQLNPYTMDRCDQ